jgi:hypothetical protein
METREEKEIPVMVRAIFEVPTEDGDVIEMETRMQVELSENSLEQIKRMFFKGMSMSVTVVTRDRPKIMIVLEPSSF